MSSPRPAGPLRPPVAGAAPVAVLASLARQLARAVDEAGIDAAITAAAEQLGVDVPDLASAPDGAQLPAVLTAMVAGARDRLAAQQAAAEAAGRLVMIDAVGRAFRQDADRETAVMRLAGIVVPDLADWCTITLATFGGEQRTVGWAHRDPAIEPALARYARVQAAAMNAAAAVAVCLRTGQEVLAVIPALDRWVGPASAQALLAELAPRSVAVLPLSAGGRTLGAMALVSTTGIEPPSAGQLSAARAVARPAGLALDNLRLRDRAALLGRVTDEVSGTLDAERAGGRLARTVVPALADWCIVSLVEDESNQSMRSVRDVGSWHVDPESRATLARYSAIRLAATRPESFVRRAAAGDGRAAVLSRATDEIRARLRPGEAADLVTELAPESAVILPLKARGRLVGLLALCNGAARGTFSGDDLDTAAEAATRAALALDTARLYRQQRDLATTLQQSLLTPPGQPDGMEVAVRYQPAVTQAQVGGDWYDAFPVARDVLTVVVGDVAGHGRDAAAEMAQVRNVLRGVAQAAGGSPAAVLTRLDRALDRLSVETMATAVLCQLSLAPSAGPSGGPGGGRRLRWSNAGHPAPLLVGPDGTAQLLSRAPDRLLGIEAAVGAPAVRTDHVVDLAPGSTLVLYTDGLVEGRRQSLDEGEQRLLALFPELAGLGVQELADALIERLAADAEDDVALLVLRC